MEKLRFLPLLLFLLFLFLLPKSNFFFNSLHRDPQLFAFNYTRLYGCWWCTRWINQYNKSLTNHSSVVFSLALLLLSSFSSSNSTGSPSFGGLNLPATCGEIDAGAQLRESVVHAMRLTAERGGWEEVCENCSADKLEWLKQIQE